MAWLKIDIPPSVVFPDTPKTEPLQAIDALASVITQTTTELQIVGSWPEPMKSKQGEVLANNLFHVAQQLLALASEFAGSAQQAPEEPAPKQ